VSAPRVSESVRTAAWSRDRHRRPGQPAACGAGSMLLGFLGATGCHCHAKKDHISRSGFCLQWTRRNHSPREQGLCHHHRQGWLRQRRSARCEIKTPTRAMRHLKARDGALQYIGPVWSRGLTWLSNGSGEMSEEERRQVLGMHEKTVLGKVS